MTTLFQAAQADAIQRASDHADPDWKREAYAAVRICAAVLADFTADDVWDLLEARPAKTHEPAALGPIFRRAQRDGIIRNTHTYRASRSPRRHRDLLVWTLA